MLESVRGYPPDELVVGMTLGPRWPEMWSLITQGKDSIIMADNRVLQARYCLHTTRLRSFHALRGRGMEWETGPSYTVFEAGYSDRVEDRL